MRSEEVVVSARQLVKSYRLFEHPGDRIKQFFSLGLRRYHQEFTALRDVSFDIQRGETIGIIGSNGSGKSTLLQLVCGVLKPSNGTISVHGRVAALLELGAGFNPEFTGRENVYFQGAIMGIERSALDARLQAIQAFADIGEFFDQPVRTYSSGMYVRLAFAAAIHVEPDILVIDEALAVGDVSFQHKCFQRIEQLQRDGTTVLLVTHSLDLVSAYCQRVLLLDHGELIAFAAPKPVLDEYRRRLNVRSRQHAQASAVTTEATKALWRDAFVTNRDEVRYGSGTSEVLEAGWFTKDDSPTQTLERGDLYTLKLRVRLTRDSPTPFFSYVIKDATGLALTGSSTQMESFSIEASTVDQTRVICFETEILLNPGHYLLSVGSQSYNAQGLLEAEDHRTDYLPFSVVGKPRHGFFSAPVTIYWEDDHP